jgi:hypothetical protein
MNGMGARIYPKANASPCVISSGGLVLNMGQCEKDELVLEDALHLKTAEVWLEVSQPLRALKELLSLSEEAWTAPWTVRVFRSLGASILECH